MGKKKPLSDIAYEVITAMEGDFNGALLKNKYHIVSVGDGERILLTEKEGRTVKVVKEKLLRSDVLNYCRGINEDGYKLLSDQARSVANTAIFQLQPLAEKPPMLGLQENADQLCFHRVPFLLDDSQDTPLFDEMMNRTKNNRALRLFIGSLFVPGSDKSQYVWLFGAGKNGKGSLTRLLERCLGRCYATESIPDKRNRFWTHGLVEKRLVVFSEGESSDAGFPSSGFFKSLTGGDSVRIEEKGGAVYTAPLDCKFIFLNNNMPILENNMADTRRAIFCEMGPIKDTEMHDYEVKLWAEAPGIIGKCFMEYMAHSVGADNPYIPIDPNTLTAVTQITDDTMQGIFDELFLLTYDDSKQDRNQDYVTGPEMQNLLKRVGKLGKVTDRSKFVTWLKDNHCIINKPFRDADQNLLRGFVGIKAYGNTFARNTKKSNGPIGLVNEK